MDVLDTYKQAWKNQPEENKDKISREEIFMMMQKKSSSIVKWIFLISIGEFIAVTISYFFFDLKEMIDFYENLGLKNFLFFSSIMFYIILFYFLYKFYNNYKSISVIEDNKKLMSKILKTRKTVKNYMLFNLFYIVVNFIALSIASFSQLEQAITNRKNLIFIFVTIITLILFVGLFWLIYQLLYGILLRKLNKNYKELVNLDA